MKAIVRVDQLKSDDGHSFLNTINVCGGVCVWGNFYEKPTFLLLETGSNIFALVEFDNEKYVEEGLEELATHIGATTAVDIRTMEERKCQITL